VQNLRTFCEAHLAGRYELEVVDLYQQPHLAQADHILAIPTLIRKLPLPPRQFIGDLSEPQALLAGLGLEPATPS
jgi:circadian clock protein KaiB